MKNLHFYIQSIMMIAALAIAVQIPLDSALFGYVVMIQSILGVYQLGMSWLLMNKLSRPTVLLRVYVMISLSYVIAMIFLGVISPDWLTGDIWVILLFMVPWPIAILFLVALNELEAARNYRV